MKKLLGAMFLMGATLLVVSGTAETFAQGKKGAKTGTIELIESKDGKFRFSVRDMMVRWAWKWKWSSAGFPLRPPGGLARFIPEFECRRAGYENHRSVSRG
jgi:hypothetical protein